MTVKAVLLGGVLAFIGENADRIRKVRTDVVPVGQDTAHVRFMLSDLPTLTADVVRDGWKIQIG